MCTKNFTQIFIETLFTVSNIWKQPVSINRWMNKGDVVHTYNGILLGIKKKEILPFAATWMELEGILSSEISQIKTNTVWFHLYIESKKCNKLVNMTKEKQTHRYREWTSGYGVGEYRGWGSGRYKLLYVR